MKITSRKNIPAMGDMVEEIKYNKDRTMGCIIFDNGKKTFFATNPLEFGVQKTKIISKPSLSKPKFESKSVNPMVKNSPQDETYQNNVFATLARMDGKTIEQVKSEIAENKMMGSEITLDTEPMSMDQEEFELKKQQVLEASEARSRRLAEEISRSSGGKIEGQF